MLLLFQIFKGLARVANPFEYYLLSFHLLIKYIPSILIASTEDIINLTGIIIIIIIIIKCLALREKRKLMVLKRGC